MRPRLAAGLLLVLLACGKTEKPLPKMAPVEAPAVISPWAWHPLGSLAVIEGEVMEPTELVLEGRSIHERRFAEFGPVRWEFFRPPEGETAVLRTDKGVVLARFEFSVAPPTPKAAPAPPRVARQMEAAAPRLPWSRPAPPSAPAPQVQAEARLQNPGLAPLPGRKAQALPSAAEAPILPPSVRTDTRAQAQTVAPLQGRKPQALPNAAEAPVLPPSIWTEARTERQPESRLQGRKPQILPRAAEAPVLPPTVRTDTRSQSQSVVPLQGRKAPALPTAAEAPVLPPSIWTEARTQRQPESRLESRKPQALPTISEPPALAASHVSSVASLHLEPSFTRPPRPGQPTAPGLVPIDPNSLTQRNPPQTPSTATGLWPGMGEALNLTRGPRGQRRLLLSFDGGSSAEVATEVLDLLKARGVRTTLFLTGAFIRRFPALVKRMVAEGHEIGNHTMNHPHFAPGMKRDPKWTRERIQRELLDADNALVRLTGRPMDPFWRAPYGEQTAEIRKWAEELGYRHVGWSEGADTLDWATPKERRLYRTGDAIVQRLQQRLGKDGDGLIVLMHLGSGRVDGDRPTDGLGAFMDRALREGWTFVSAGSLLRDLGKPAWDSHQRLALLNGSTATAR